MTRESSDLVTVTAEAFLDEFGLDCGTRLEDVASRLGLRVMEVSASSFDGALVRIVGHPSGTIALRAGITPPGRRQFTLAHELGHYVLPNQQDELASPCRPSAIESWADSVSIRELDANRFAAEILMPRRLLTDAIRRQPSFAIAEEVAGRFHTSLTAATFRIVELSTFRLAMVVSRGGAVEWYRATKEFARAVRTGRLDPRTIAHDLFGDEVATRPTRIPADAWLFDHNLRDNATVLEHSIALRAYGLVLTLLELEDQVEMRTDYDEEPVEELDSVEFTLRRKNWPRS